MGTTGVIILSIGAYLILLLALGLIANKQRKSNTLKDFYLAGGNMGAFVLLFTLYATQYSANTMLVTPAEVVNKGMGMILILGYMTAVVVFYLTFAPQLYNISKKQSFITPGDWFDYRFKSPKLTLLANGILVLVSINFLLSQLMAMGHIVNGVTDGQIPYWVGVVSLAFVVIVYETLGGMRAVAWTDVIQGIMLFIGLIGLFIMVMPSTDELAKISIWLIENEPKKIAVPDVSFRIYWASLLLMIGLGGAVYPQVIQRIYAAKSVKTLRNSLGAMIIMPLVTVLILFLLGVISIPHFIDSEGVSKDTVLPEMLHYWGSLSVFNFGLMIMVVVALIAAIMSTADSVLLSLSSIIAKDIFGKSKYKSASSEKLTKLGKLCSWVIMFIMVLVALHPKITLWGLIELKMQILVQVAPLFLLGVHSKTINSKGMFLGLAVGFLFATGAFLIGVKTIGNIHVGLIGFVLNIMVAYSFSKKSK
ncbi:sodium:solute symporter family protein [Winogradskyella sp.]|uniref:sodium:solute symporter family protein n=1 Tax=Winogradskyella sp. TaxID=1883156 RepID=UPI003BAAA0AD